MKMDFNWESVNGLAKALGGRVELLEKMLGLKVREGLKYADIQKIVKSGFAKEFFDLGDEIMTTYTATDGTEYDFPWLVVDFRDVYWENDPNPHPGMVLQSVYATAEQLVYDNDSNLWSESSLRQWLNSDEENNELNGFLCGFSSDFLNVATPKRITQVYSNGVSYSYDKFYIASGVEMYAYIIGALKDNIDTYYEYWVKKTGLDYASPLANTQRVFTSINNKTTAVTLATRTYFSGVYLDNRIMYLTNDGSINTLAHVDNACNVLPCCVIS